MSHKPFDERLEDWKQKYGSLASSKNGGVPYHRIEINGRLASIIALMVELREEGKDKDFFKAHYVREAILNCCMPPEAYRISTKKRKGWTSAVTQDIKAAISVVFNGEEISSDRVIVIESKNGTKASDTEFDPVKQGRLSTDFTDSDKKTIESPVVRVTDPELEKLLGFDQ